MKINTNKIFFLSCSLSFALCSCNAKKNDLRSLDQLVPETVDNSAIAGITNYEKLQKFAASSYGAVSLQPDAKFEEEKELYIDGFQNEIGNLGELTFLGDSFENTRANNKLAIGNTGKFLAFTYLENIQKTYSYNGKECSIYDSQIKKIDGFSTATEAHSGSLVLLKSPDSVNWNLEAYITDINRRAVLFTPDSDDVYKGTYYKLLNQVEFTFVYEYRTVTNGFLWWKKTREVPVQVNFRLTQSIEFFLCNSSSNLRFECASTSAYRCDDSSLTKEEIELVQKSVSMSDLSVSTSYIDVSLLNPYAKFTYSYEGEDGSETGEFAESHKFTKPGKYRFKSTNRLGKTQETTLFIVNLKNDNGFSQFFGDGVCDGSRRMFDSSKPLPVYMIGKKYDLCSIPSYLPGRYGGIYYYKDDASLASNSYQTLKTYADFRDEDSLVLDKQGYYFFAFTNCDPAVSSGDILQYTFSFYVSNNVYYSPSVNYGLLRSSRRTNLLATKVYGVSLPTTAGGSYQFIFPYAKDYVQKAYDLAVEIEELSVEIINYNGEKCYFYKSLDNPYVKTNYVSKVALYDAINKYADQNVSVVYLENDIEFGTSIVEDESLSNLSSRSIKNTVRVVSDENVLNSLRSTELYLNGFKFTQIADFEVDNVSATNSSGESFAIPFDTSVDGLFGKSEKVEITEKNWNGTKTYKAIFSKNNSCEITAMCGGVKRKIDIKDDGAEYSFKSFKFDSVQDEFDSQTLVAINDGRTRDVFSMKEIEGLSLPKGEFSITLINRNQQTYQFHIKCTGVPSGDTTASYNHDPLRENVVKVPEGNVGELTPEGAIDSKILVIIMFAAAIVLSSGITFAITYAVERKKRG